MSEKIGTAGANGDQVSIRATPAARRLAGENRIHLAQVQPTGLHGEIQVRDVQNAIRDRPRATHLARAIADKLGIDLEDIPHSGERITKQDVLGYRPETVSERAETVEKSMSPDENGVPMTGMRKVIAKRMAASHADIPPVTQCTKVDVTSLLALREQINRNRKREENISVNDMILKAVAKILPKFARFRMTLEDEEFVCHDPIHIGMAVGLEDGLVVPVIRDADQKSVEQISHEAKELVRKARENKLSAKEMGDARITVTNLGMFGTYCFTPIVNQPEAAIVGVCSIEDELGMRDGAIEVRKMMMICVTYDHRIINGMESSLFQCAIRDLLENPIEILL